MHIDLLVENIGELVTVAGANRAPRRGAALSELGIVRGGAVAIAGQQIVAVGEEKTVKSLVQLTGRTRRVDAAGGTVLPGFVDPHTHLVFAGTRAEEYSLRARGATYEEILAAGGGIHATTRLTREATEEALFQVGWGYLDTMMRHGTTTVEAKSGYGLDLSTELKLLRVTKQLGAAHPLEVVSTFLGAHVIPAAFREQPEAYVSLVVDKMLPEVAAEGLAEYCDVWCDEGIFTVDQARRILAEARARGLRLRLHANQLAAGGGARLAAELGADSVDHLEQLSASDIPILAASQTVAILVPGVAFTLRQPNADARALIEGGVAVALATDFNPGSCFCESMPMMIALACSELAMTPAEAIVASTINAAWSLRRADRVGSLEVGKQADLVLLHAPSHAHLAYHFGINLVHTVIKAGRVVVEAGQLA